MSHDRNVPGGGRPPTLIDRARGALRMRHYSYRTEEAYVAWTKRFTRFHGMRHPRDLGEPEVTAFLSHLAVHDDVAASTQNQALSALLVLYQTVLGVSVDWLVGIVRAKRPRRLPVVLTRDEVHSVLSAMEGVVRLICTTLYGTGMRLPEGLRLRAQDLDFALNQILRHSPRRGRLQHPLEPGAARSQ